MKKKLERIKFSIVAKRLGNVLHCNISIAQVNILVNGWNRQRKRRGRNPINFAQRVKDEVYWQQTHGMKIDKERFFFADELELFSRYAGYDLSE